jgi:hypothetical protein
MSDISIIDTIIDEYYSFEPEMGARDNIKYRLEQLKQENDRLKEMYVTALRYYDRCCISGLPLKKYPEFLRDNGVVILEGDKSQKEGLIELEKALNDHKQGEGDKPIIKGQDKSDNIGTIKNQQGEGEK